MLALVTNSSRMCRNRKANLYSPVSQSLRFGVQFTPFWPATARVSFPCYAVPLYNHSFFQTVNTTAKTRNESRKSRVG